MLESERKLYDTEKIRECSEKACFDVYRLSLKEYGMRWPMGNKVQVFLDLYNWQGFFKEEYIDFQEDKNYKDVVDELVTKHGNHGRIWVVLQEIAL